MTLHIIVAVKGVTNACTVTASSLHQQRMVESTLRMAMDACLCQVSCWSLLCILVLSFAFVAFAIAV